MLCMVPVGFDCRVRRALCIYIIPDGFGRPEEIRAAIPRVSRLRLARLGPAARDARFVDGHPDFPGACRPVPRRRVGGASSGPGLLGAGRFSTNIATFSW